MSQKSLKYRISRLGEASYIGFSYHKSYNTAIKHFMGIDARRRGKTIFLERRVLNLNYPRYSMNKYRYRIVVPNIVIKKKR